MESSRRADRELGNGTVRSPLHGVPVAIKDQIHMSGVRTTGGSALWDDCVPVEDATVVRNLKRAGAIIVGKTTMSELAFGNVAKSSSGLTRNPWDLTRTPGVQFGFGSSHGRSHPTSLGADTGGSIRKQTADSPAFGRRGAGLADMVSSAHPGSWTPLVHRPYCRGLCGDNWRGRGPRPQRSVLLECSRA